MHETKPRMASLLEAVAADPVATLAPYRAEVAALKKLAAARWRRWPVVRCAA